MPTLKPLRKAALLGACLLASNAIAQFSGPSTTGRSVSVQQARDARLGSYVTVTGSIVNHQRSDYYTFRDASGEIRVEIASGVWQNRKVEPDTKVRLLAEVDSGPAGRYLYVKSLDVVN
jgi:uncharacterized protein (TIGR00156 family)